MKKLSWFSAPLVITLFAGYWLIAGSTGAVHAESRLRPLPEFTQASADAWLNSAPLKKSDLKGKVVLIDVWTLACWNCYRSFPWLHSIEEQFANNDFQVVGIHSPEFEYEHNRRNVEKAIAKYKLQHPVMMDNDFAYWRALNNRYWPAFYLVDKQGNIRYHFVGEIHQGDARAEKVELAIQRLLAE